MIAIILLLITGKSISKECNCQINLSESNYFILLSDDQITIYRENNKKSPLNSWNIEDANIFYPKINIISHSKDLYKLIISNDAHKPLHIKLDIENKNARVDFTNIYFDKDTKYSYDGITIDFYSNTQIYFHDIPSGILVKASKDNYLIDQILPKSNRNKIVICYGGNDCSKHPNFSIQNDQTYLSNINEENFQDFINTFISNSQLKYIRFLLIERGNDYLISFGKIPSEKVDQIQLYGYSENNVIPTLKLNESTETRNIKSWFVNDVKFSQSDEIDKSFYFNDFTYTKSNGFLSKFNHKNVKIKSSQISLFEDCTYQPGSNNENSITFNIGGSDGLNCDGLSVDGSNVKNDFTIIIKRVQNTQFNKLNLLIDGFQSTVTVRFECDDYESKKHFEYHITSLKEGQRILTDSGTCNNVDIKINKPDADEPSSSDKEEGGGDGGDDDGPISQPTPSQPSSGESSQTPVLITNYTYYSYTINVTSIGFVNDTSSVSIDMDKVNQINFGYDNITIYENSILNSSSPLYFTALKKGSKIIIDKDVSSSNIGVTSVNSPIIQIQKTVIPLSFYHDNIEGESVTIFVNEYELKENEILVLNEVNNRKGNFTLHCVDNSIKTVSLSVIIMSNVSSFSVIQNQIESSLKHVNEDDDRVDFVDVHVRDKINITQQSISTLNNFNLSGRLCIHDDSKLTIENDAIFSNNSEIEFIISHNFDSNKEIENEVKPMISVLGELRLKPSEIVLSSGESGVPINVVDFPVFSFSNSSNCTEFEDLFVFENGREGQISTNCSEIDDNQSVLLLTAVEKIKKKKKLSAGVIAGLVIAAVFVVGMIIALAIFFCRKKKNEEDNVTTRGAHNRSGNKKRLHSLSEDDSNSVGL